MSATEAPRTETAPVEAPPPVERRCPRCGAPMREEQEWCLQCGTGVGAVVAPPRGWRVPLAAVGTLLALAIVAVVLAIVELANDAEQVTTANPTPAPAPTAAPTAAPPSVPTPSPTPSATATPTTGASTGGASPLADWPAGKTGFTIVLESDATRSAAEARAKELAGQGMSVGVLDSSGYKTLTPNRFVVFSGQYASRAEARKALAGIRSRVAGAQVKRVAPA